jgi:hypothetical protein
MTLTIAHKPYTPERLHEKTVNVLNAIFDFAGYDLRSEDTVYDGRTREQTVTEAQQTRRDVLDELHLRAGMDALAIDPGQP